MPQLQEHVHTSTLWLLINNRNIKRLSIMVLLRCIRRRRRRWWRPLLIPHRGNLKSYPPKRPWILSCCFPLRCMAARTSQLLSWPSFAPPPPPPCKCPALATCWPCASSPTLTSAVAVSTPAGPKSREVDGQQSEHISQSCCYVTRCDSC